MYRIFVDNEIFCDSRDENLVILNPVVVLEMNMAGSFTFTIPPNHPKYDVINRRTSIISVYRDDDTEPLFQGICISESVDFYLQKKIVCEGELTYLNDSILRPAHYSTLTPLSLLTSYINQHNEQVEVSKRFTIGNVTVSGSASCYTNMHSTMQEINEDLIDDFGGYICIRYADGKKYIDYLEESTHNAVQTIALGENLLDYTSNIDSEEIATRIIPLGAMLEEQEISGLDTRLDIKSVNSGIDYLENVQAQETYGIITKTVIYDNVHEASNLKAKGQQYLDDIQFENVVIEVKAVDLGYIEDIPKFKLADKLHIKSSAHGMDRWFVLTKMELNLNDPDKDVFTLGKSEKISLTAKTVDIVADTEKRLNDIPSTDFLRQAIAQATALITGAEGGYVVIHTDANKKPYEILIMDTDDITTAQKVWRWNQNGLGYSSTGYNGTYALAMTSNGEIVADFVKSGTMYADRIKGGTLSLGGLNNVDGVARMYNASNTQVGVWDNLGFAVGDSSAYRLELRSTNAQIHAVKNGVDIGSINFFDSHSWTIDGQTLNYNQLNIRADDVMLEGTFVDINADHVNVKYASNSYYYGSSGTAKVLTDLQYTSISRVVTQLDSSGSIYVKDIGGSVYSINTGFSWYENNFSYCSGYYYSNLTFTKGLLVTALS